MSSPSSVLHRNLHARIPCAVKGEGSYLILDDGRRVLDSTAGAAVACLGHGNKEVKEAIVDQLDRIEYTHTTFFTVPSFEELARFLIDTTHGQMDKVFIVNSGSEANEVAMKLARQYFLELPTPQPQRHRFISRAPSYHGVTLGALALGGHTTRREFFEPLLAKNVSFVSPCYEYRGKRDDESDADYVQRLEDELDAEFQRVGPETVCGFVAEPIVGASMGCVPAVAGYFAAARRVCDRYGALLIMDEVMCGMGRVGTLHAWEQEGVAPDIQTIGKGLGAGFVPVSGILMNERVVQAFDKGTGAFRHGQTYQGHAVGCAAALAVQRIVQRENLLENVRAMGKLLEKRLREKLSGHPNVGDIRGKGLFWGVELVRDKATKETFPPKYGLASRIQLAAMGPEYSFQIYSGSGTADGVNGDHVLLAPPYTVTAEEIEIVAELTLRVITDVTKEVKDELEG